MTSFGDAPATWPWAHLISFPLELFPPSIKTSSLLPSRRHRPPCRDPSLKSITLTFSRMPLRPVSLTFDVPQRRGRANGACARLRLFLPSSFSPLDNCLTSIIANLNHLTLHSLDDDLLSRRRLGKTNLSVKPGQIGTSNATKPENLGLFEYAHLRAPLPKDLKGSEIFPSHNSAQHPETYFLMVSGLIRLCLSMTHQTSH